jgi:hypothetical protein
MIPALQEIQYDDVQHTHVTTATDMNDTSDDMDEQGIIYNVIAPITQHAHDVDNDKYKAIEQSTVHSDATGRFPIRSKAGNEYVMTTVYNGYI